MNSRLFVILSLVLLLAAGAAGWFGYQTTVEARQQMAAAEATVAEVKAQAAAEAANRHPVLVASRDLKAFQVLNAEDLALDHLAMPVPQAFTAPEQLIGKFVQTDVAAGSVLLLGQFQPGSEVARLLRPGERALAIAVDEVIGGGGFVKPGDTVDVLMYVPGESRPSSSAQVVMRALRVVGFGTQLASAAALRGDTPATSTPSAQPAEQSDPRSARTAILAVREQDTTRLMLASSVGILRLAIRPADEGGSDVAPVIAGRTGPRDNRLERAGALAPLGPAQAAPRLNPPPATSPRAGMTSAAKPSGTGNIVIFRGLNRADAP
ncbi:Flp pilus assembly protein CpaB [Perlucidibaca piscinae]|uniref:Flp pilus assembly protein CpaB n=1 Tax=Perlucidibaca piscinae TaxID=392589 RepID=UPI0003B3EDFC|nr:Flp pilus assembly protein CpaB [Perlucidibaca piscinae]